MYFAVVLVNICFYRSSFRELIASAGIHNYLPEDFPVLREEKSSGLFMEMLSCSNSCEDKCLLTSEL